MGVGGGGRAQPDAAAGAGHCWATSSQYQQFLRLFLRHAARERLHLTPAWGLQAGGTLYEGAQAREAQERAHWAEAGKRAGRGAGEEGEEGEEVGGGRGRDPPAMLQQPGKCGCWLLSPLPSGS